MNIDIRLRCGFLENPKIVKLRRRHGADAVLSLIRFWMYVAQNKPTGDLGKMDSEDIDIACGEHAFSMHDAMLEFGLIDKTKNGLRVHDWEEEQSWACKSPERKARAKAAADERWERERIRRVKVDAPSMLCVYDEHAGSNAPILSFPFLTLPSHFAQSREFSDAWIMWEKYRKEKRKVLGQTTVEQQIKSLTKYPVEVAVASLTESVKNGWTGLFPEKIQTTATPVISIREKLAKEAFGHAQ